MNWQKSSGFFALMFSELLQKYRIDGAPWAARVVERSVCPGTGEVHNMGPPTEIQAIYDSSVWHGKASDER